MHLLREIAVYVAAVGLRLLVGVSLNGCVLGLRTAPEQIATAATGKSPQRLIAFHHIERRQRERERERERELFLMWLLKRTPTYL